MAPPRFDISGIAGDKPAVVIDIGNAYTKVGFAGEWTPRSVLRSRLVDGDDGNELVETALFPPDGDEQQQGRVLRRFLRHLYHQHLLAVARERRVVIVESVLAATNHRQLLARLLFDTFDVPSVLFAPAHLLACFPFGTQDALVVDIGHREILVLPIFEGVALLNSWEAAPIGMAAVQRRLRELLLARATVDDGRTVKALSTIPALLTDDLLEDVCVRFCFATTLERGRAIQTVQHAESSATNLTPPPDVRLNVAGNQVLNIPGSVREAAAEVMFEYDDDCKSLPQLILDCLLRCPVDLRRPLCERLLVIGGGSQMVGFLARLKTELLDLLSTKYNSRLPLSTVKFFRFKESPVEMYASWLGGSLFGALEVLPYRSLSREEWQKSGRVPDWTAKIASSTGVDEPGEDEQRER